MCEKCRDTQLGELFGGKHAVLDTNEKAEETLVNNAVAEHQATIAILQEHLAKAKKDLAESQEEYNVLLRCLKGSSKGMFTAEMYNKESDRAKAAEAISLECVEWLENTCVQCKKHYSNCGGNNTNCEYCATHKVLERIGKKSTLKLDIVYAATDVVNTDYSQYVEHGVCIENTTPMERLRKLVKEL